MDKKIVLAVVVVALVITIVAVIMVMPTQKPKAEIQSGSPYCGNNVCDRQDTNNPFKTSYSDEDCYSCPADCGECYVPNISTRTGGESPPILPDEELTCLLTFEHVTLTQCDPTPIDDMYGVLQKAVSSKSAVTGGPFCMNRWESFEEFDFHPANSNIEGLRDVIFTCTEEACSDPPYLAVRTGVGAYANANLTFELSIKCNESIYNL